MFHLLIVSKTIMRPVYIVDRRDTGLPGALRKTNQWYLEDRLRFATGARGQDTTKPTVIVRRKELQQVASVQNASTVELRATYLEIAISQEEDRSAASYLWMKKNSTMKNSSTITMSLPSIIIPGLREKITNHIDLWDE